MLVMDALVVDRVLGHHLQQIVIFTGDQVAFHHFWHLTRRRLETAEIALLLAR